MFKLNGARGLRNGGAGQTKLNNVAFENEAMVREATDGTYNLMIRVGDPSVVGGTGAYAAFANGYYDFFTALDLAIENGEIMYFVGDMYNFSSQNYVTLGNTDANVTAPESVVFMGINLGTPETPVWPIIKQTATNRVISLYDGSDIEMYNLDIQVQSRLIQVYAGSSAADHTTVTFGANTTLSLYTATLGAESLIHAAGSFSDFIFEEGSVIDFTVTLNINTENTAQRRVIMDFFNAGGGSLTFKGSIRMHVTDNCPDKSDEFIMFNANGSIVVHVYSTAAFDFYAPTEGNERDIVTAMNVKAPFYLHGFTAEAGDRIVNDMKLGVKVETPNGDQIASSTLSGIMGVVPSGSTLYLYNSFSDSNIPVSGQFTIIPKGEETVTINNNSAGSPLFVFTTGSKDAPVKLWIDNVNITGTSTGNTFNFSENAYAIVDLKNVTVDQATANYAFYVAGSATLSLTLKDVDITIKNGFAVIENTTFSMTADGLKMTNTSYSIYTACQSGSAIVINLKNSEITANVALYFLNPSNVRASFDNVKFETVAWVVSSQAQAKLELDFNNCTMINDRAHILRTYGTAGSYVNINNCTMISSLAAPGVYTYCTSYPAAVIAGSALTMNIYGGYFQSSGAAVIATLSATSVINVYGGTFNYVGNHPGISPVMNDQGVVNIYGGNFRTETTLAPVFGNGNRTTNTMNLYSLVANGPTNLITNLGLGTPSANHSTGYGHTTLNGLKMTTGATPDFTASAMGMKFMVTLDAATYAHICSLADDATETTAEVSYGMLLVETSKLTDELASNFSHYGFNRLGFTDVIELIATSANVVKEADGCVTVTLTLTESQMASISTAYSVVAYAKYTINGNTVYMYSNYNSAKNSRSLEQIARSAYNDRAVAADSIYTTLVSEGSYSRYTTEQLAQLATWCNDDTAQKVMDIYLVAGGSNAMGLTSYNKQFADAITNADVLSDHVFYSGLVSQHALQDLTVDDYYATASKYTVSGSLADLGYGWLASQIGPELGMAKALSEQYNADSGKYAAIVKYAFADSNLLDILEGYDESAGNWAPTSETPAGAKSGALYTAYMDLIATELRNYVDQGYKVNIVGMYWMQGEDDIAADANTTYAEQFSKFVANVRMSLSTIYLNETGNSIDLTAMPVAVGEVATFLGNDLDDKRDAFATLQNTFAAVMTDGMLTSGIAGVSIIPTSQFPADEDGIFLNPDDVLLAGELAAALLMQKGSNSLADGTVIETPEITPAATIVDIDGNPVLGEDEQPLAYRSLAMAAALAPANSTLKLAGDQTAYASLSFKNLKNLTIDGDNHTITFESDDIGIKISGTAATLKNVQIVHNGSAPAIVADKNTTLTLSGANTSINAETTAIVMEGANSRLVIEDGTYATRSATGLATDTIVYTASAHVVIEDGTFTAADGATCLIVDEDAPTKLAVNVKGGTFSASDLIDDTNNIKAPAFVNMSVVAVLVISPEALVTTSQDTEICVNMGFGTNGALNDAFN